MGAVRERGSVGDFTGDSGGEVGRNWFCAFLNIGNALLYLYPGAAGLILWRWTDRESAFGSVRFIFAVAHSFD